jgi:hypothetical protein
MKALGALVDEFAWLHEDHARSQPHAGSFVLSGKYPVQEYTTRERDPVTGLIVARTHEYGTELVVHCQFPAHPDDARAMRGECDTSPAALPLWSLMAHIPGDNYLKPLVWVHQSLEVGQVAGRLQQHMHAFPGIDDLMDE